MNSGTQCDEGERPDCPCPYCGSSVTLRDASHVHGVRGNGLLYVCDRFPRCDAYVGVHEGSSRPLGTLADRELRIWRRLAHESLDPLWRSGRMARREAYRLLQEILAVPAEHAHIAMLNLAQCRVLIRELARRFPCGSRTHNP